MLRALCYWLGLGLSACGGHAVDLDRHSSPAPEPSADGGAVETTIVPDTFRSFWVDDGRVYMNGTTLQSCEYAQCGETRVDYALTTGVALALSETDVFFPGLYEDSNLFTCPKTGCGGSPRLLFSDTTSLWSFTTDADYLYWSSSYDIYRCPLGDCGEIPQFVAAGETAQNTLLVRGDSAFWTTAGEPNADGTLSSLLRIRSAPVDGSRPPETLVTADILSAGWGNQFGMLGHQFDLDDAYIYWLDNSSNVQRCPRAGCQDAQPTTFVAGSAPVSKLNLYVDASGLYWLEAAQGNTMFLRYCPLTGCGSSGPTALTAATVSNFALDSKYVYWDEVRSTQYGDVAGNRVHRMLKPAP